MLNLLSACLQQNGGGVFRKLQSHSHVLRRSKMLLRSFSKASWKILTCLVALYFARNACEALPAPVYSSENQDERFEPKRDVFMSRGWGAGGMPYNVMYVGPKGTRTRGQETPRMGEDVLLKNPVEMADEDIEVPIARPSVQFLTAHPGIILRGDLNPPRKQYSIIPQLFVSYGWGPLGK